MEKYQTAGRLIIRRPCLVLSGENVLCVTLGSLRTLCTRSAKRITSAFFHFLEALKDCKWRSNIFQRKICIFQRKIWSFLSTVSKNSFKVSSAWMASYLVYRVSEKHQVRNFRLPWSAWGLLIKVKHFRINIFWISKRNMEKYRTAKRLIILSLVTSLEERQRHWQFALQFLFPALHGQQPRPLFRVQTPLHGQRTSTDPWFYLTRMTNFN